MHSLNW